MPPQQAIDAAIFVLVQHARAIAAGDSPMQFARGRIVVDGQSLSFGVLVTLGAAVPVVESILVGLNKQSPNTFVLDPRSSPLREPPHER